ncbi:MAG: cell division topological specificity factor MinE [Clostridia bacterium]|nr:cell division topological specificity factor MinE [Clostridia bacterium]
MGKKEQSDKSKNAAKERLHLVLMQDRANVSADFLEMMKMEIVDVIKKYIDVDETDMDVKLENRVNNDGTSGAPALYANIPIMGINEEKKKESEELTKAKQAEEEQVAEEENKSATTKKGASNKKLSTKTAKTAKTAKAVKTDKASKIVETVKKTAARRTKKDKAEDNAMGDQ